MITDLQGMIEKTVASDIVQSQQQQQQLLQQQLVYLL